jgi:hypothetical protein
MSRAPLEISQAIDIQWLSFLSKRHFPWQIICISFIGIFPANLKFIIYENDQHRSDNNINNNIVRPVFTTNINGAR